MKTILVWCSMLLVLGCDKGQPDETMTSEGEPAGVRTQEAAGLEQQAAVTLGTLSYQAMEQVNAAIDPFQPWDPSWARVLALVGEPTLTEGNNHYWYIMNGDMCAELRLENMEGQVGIVGVTQYSEYMPERFARCQTGPAATTGTATAIGTAQPLPLAPEVGTGQGIPINLDVPAGQ